MITVSNDNCLTMFLIFLSILILNQVILLTSQMILLYPIINIPSGRLIDPVIGDFDCHFLLLFLPSIFFILWIAFLSFYSYNMCSSSFFIKLFLKWKIFQLSDLNPWLSFKKFVSSGMSPRFI